MSENIDSIDALSACNERYMKLYGAGVSALVIGVLAGIVTIAWSGHTTQVSIIGIAFIAVGISLLIFNKLDQVKGNGG